jgi:C_GCAxxG_C_C family probable redox protein
MNEKIKNQIQNQVHKYYYDHDLNCARTSLYILSEIFDVDLTSQVKAAAVGLHGAGGFRAQCGLVEGALMFIGIYFASQNIDEDVIVSHCYRFGEAFNQEFGSLKCYNLRPQGFNIDDEPHMCEDLSRRAVCFTYDFIKKIIQN